MKQIKQFLLLLMIVPLATFGYATITLSNSMGPDATVSVSVTGKPDDDVKVTSITISTPSAMTVGKTQTLTATVYPSNATNKTVKWSSDNNNMATINETTGLVTAKSAGTVKITCAATDGSSVTATCTIAINDSPNQKLTLLDSPSGGSVESGTKVYLTVKADGATVSGADIYYTANGSTPSKSSTKYTSSGITINSATTIKAIAYKDGYETSDVGSWSYSVNSATKEAYAVLSNEGNTVTFYYDTQKAVRGGININTDSSDNPYADVTTAIFDASFAEYHPTSTAYWFYNCKSLTTITGISYLKTDNVTNMRNMFFLCSNLTSLNLNSFKTDNVTNMSYMFRSCTGLKTLYMNGFKTGNVTDMNSMFYHCSGLTDLDLRNFKTDKVTDMRYMFDSCAGLTNLDLSSFKTDNVTNMNGMFRGCTGLTSLDLSSFKTDNVKNMSQMFSGCTNLQTIYVSDEWSSEKVGSGVSMFDGCTKLVGGQGTTYDESHTNHIYARIDGGASYPGYFTRKEVGIAINEINFPDENFRNYLLGQNYGADKVISKEELAGITSLSMERKNISNLKGIELFTYLETLDCFGNQLSDLNLSENVSLRMLMCNYNILTTLDFSNNPNIEQIRCDNNCMKGDALDALIKSLPQNTSYTEHYILLIDNSENSEANVCTRAQATAIRAKGWTPYYYNGTKGDKYGWVELYDSEETDVIVINEDNIPDANFRDFLLEQDYGKSRVLLPGKLMDVKDLDISNKAIADLKGIEYFSALEWLRCDGNSLTSLDMSKNTSLQSLWCHNNRIVKLVLPNSSTLKTVLCSRNKISGSAMDDLINNLPNNWTSEEHSIALVDYSKNDEENICTNSQVSKIKNKGWRPMYLKTTDTSLGGGDYEGNEITIMTSDSGYATFYARNFAYSLPNELSALVPSNINSSKLSYTSLTSAVVPPSTPVILSSNVKHAKAYTLTITGTSANYSGTNLLRGSDEAQMTTGDGYHYKLSYGQTGTAWSDVFGWYWGANDGGSFMTEGHKAWLVVPKSAATTRGFTVDGETTGISTLEVSEEEAVYYDLQGRRISKPTVKGVYIKNGKKVMVK